MSNVTLEKGLDAPLVAFEELPVIDMADFISGKDKQGVANKLGRACRDVGFLYLINHGVDEDAYRHIFDLAKRHFDKPHDVKMEDHVSKSANHRGYFALFDENTDPDKTADLKEGFDLGRDLDANHPKVAEGHSLYGPNPWPINDPDFKRVSESYQEEMYKLSSHLLHAFAIALGLEETYFDDKFNDPLALLRMLHYPPQKGYVEEETIGCGDHTDYGAFTILAQKDVSGLQVRNANGDWISVPVIEGGLVINIGDQMARWTNGLFKATHHRVINVSGEERYSIPFFFEPNWDAEIKCLETCYSDENPPKYEPVLAGPYLLSRLTDTFTYLEDEEVQEDAA
ncbi:isopenicillin N synthase family dioxygenase [Curvivirga sp.]|uniref:isopenicillin N synthase family dioxygenase n=1 Tax=Curvivirga sp. TaxID=2856848 RepID=UPI003B5BD23C